MIDSKLSTTLVTVTYGQRGRLLSKVLSAVSAQGVSSAVVVNNGSDSQEVQLACDVSGLNCQIVSMDRNTGSATGFSTGFEYCVDSGAELIFVLDDDNVPEAGTVSLLQKEWRRLSSEHGAQDTVVLGFRPDHQADVAEGNRLARVIPDKNSFFGFAVQDLPLKLLRRLPFVRKHFRKSMAAEYQLQTAPYSGMMFHVSLLKKYGFPLKDLVLYVDDTEFTYRITKGGGRISLLTGARIEDLEASWSIKKNYSSTFKAYLHGGSDFRAFYSSRNQSYFESNRRPHNLLLRNINKYVYMSILCFLSVVDGKYARYQLIAKGVALGERGLLGEHPDFPLV